mgnify:CR=1 FL=1
MAITVMTVGNALAAFVTGGRRREWAGKLVNVPVSPADNELIRSAVSKVSLPTWAEICDKSNPGCSAAWKATVGMVVGIKDGFVPQRGCWWRVLSGHGPETSIAAELRANPFLNGELGLVRG